MGTRRRFDMLRRDRPIFVGIVPVRTKETILTYELRKEESKMDTNSKQKTLVIDRREFIINSVLVTGSVLGSMMFAGELLRPNSSFAAPAKFTESNCGALKDEPKRVLVAYASFCGSTGGIAEAIGQELCNQGLTVDIRLIKHVTDLKQYDAVVIGSAIQRSQWLGDATDFVKQNQDYLRDIPVAYFLSCLALYETNDITRQKARSYIESVLNETAPLIKPIDIGLFAGTLDYSKLSFMMRQIMKSKMKKLGVPEGDHRNWMQIKNWAKTIAPKLAIV
jgi:menaquinone-dependent protoporphyrinogen oxidase